MNTHTPNHPPGTAAWNERLGVFGLYLFAAFAFVGTAAAYLGLGLMIIALLTEWRRFWTGLRGDPLLLLLAWTAGAVAISVSLAVLQRPEELSAQIDAGQDVFRLWLFLVVAWWLQGRQQRIFATLALAMVGFLLGIARALDQTHLHALLAFERPNFKWSINAVGEYTAAALLGLLLMAPRLWHWLSKQRWRWAGVFGLTVLAALLLEGVVLCQSRGVWLSLMAVIVGLCLYAWLTRPPGRPRRRPVLLSLTLGLLIALILILNSRVITPRFAFDYQPMLGYLHSGVEVQHIADVSARERLAILQLGIESWLQKPWLGWGPGAIPVLLQTHSDRFLYADHYPDFHNIILDLLVGFGVLGTAAFFLIFSLVIYAVHQAYRSSCIDRDGYFLLLALMVFNILCQLTDTRIFSLHGRFYWLLVAGAAYSCRLIQEAQRSAYGQPQLPP
jgi:O-antigen ligase